MNNIWLLLRVILSHSLCKAVEDAKKQLICLQEENFCVRILLSFPQVLFS